MFYTIAHQAYRVMRIKCEVKFSYDPHYPKLRIVCSRTAPYIL